MTEEPRVAAAGLGVCHGRPPARPLAAPSDKRSAERLLPSFPRGVPQLGSPRDTGRF